MVWKGLKMFNLIKQIKNKFKSSKGLSLTEMLATVLLVGLMGITVATGVTTIRNTYLKIVRKANEQTLLSTTVIELRNLLRYSTEVDDTGTSLKIRSKDGLWFSFLNSEYGIKIAYLTDKNETPILNGTNTIYLVPKEDGDVSSVYSSFDSIDYNNGVFTITGLKVKGAEDDGTAVKVPYVVTQITQKIGGAS